MVAHARVAGLNNFRKAAIGEHCYVINLIDISSETYAADDAVIVEVNQPYTGKSVFIFFC